MGIFDDLKSMGKILQEAGKIEQYQKILEVQKELLDMQEKINILEDENKKLNKKLETKEKVFYKNNAYWIKIEKERDDGPFCSRCYDKDKNLIRMQPLGNPAYSRCPECQNKTKTGKESPPITRTYYRFRI